MRILVLAALSLMLIGSPACEDGGGPTCERAIKRLLQNAVQAGSEQMDQALEKQMDRALEKVDTEDPDLTQAQRDQAQAQLERAKAQREQTQAQMEMAKAMIEKVSVSLRAPLMEVCLEHKAGMDLPCLMRATTEADALACRGAELLEAKLESLATER